MSRKPSKQPVADVPEDESYRVGYGKPPKHTRFKPGQSGNPQGRPRGARNLRTAFREGLQEKVTIREGNRTRKLSKMDGIVQVTLNKALKGDAKGLAAVIQLARSTGLMDEEPETSSTQSLSVEDQAILDTFLERQGMEPSALSAENSQKGVQAIDGEAAAEGADAKADEDAEPEDRT